MTGGATATYTYDGDGNRVKSSTGTLYWGPGPLNESDTSGNITVGYFYLNGQRIARRDTPSHSVYSIISDLLGSSNMVLASDGTILNESDFLPFGGEKVIASGLANEKFKFTGKERDTESGLDFFGARYYSSSVGRWMSPDWAEEPAAVPYSSVGDPQSLNLYGYVLNNPLLRVDQDGHDPLDVAFTIINILFNNPKTAPYMQAGVTKAEHVVQKVKQTAAAHPRTMQAAKGVVKMGAGVATVGVSATAEIGSGGLATVPVIFGVMGGAGSFVAGFTDVLGAATNTNVSGVDTAVSAVSNPIGIATTLSTGSLDSGAQGSAVGDALVTLGTAEDITEGSPGMVSLKTALAGQSLEEGTQAASETVNPPRTSQPQ